MADLKRRIYPVLLAGGTGTRLWPVSKIRLQEREGLFLLHCRHTGGCR